MASSRTARRFAGSWAGLWEIGSTDVSAEAGGTDERCSRLPNEALRRSGTSQIVANLAAFRNSPTKASSAALRFRDAGSNDVGPAPAVVSQRARAVRQKGRSFQERSSSQFHGGDGNEDLKSEAGVTRSHEDGSVEYSWKACGRTPCASTRSKDSSQARVSGEASPEDAARRSSSAPTRAALASFSGEASFLRVPPQWEARYLCPSALV